METRFKKGFWVDSFLIVLGVFCLAVIGISLWTLFGNDFFALNYGKFIYLFRSDDGFVAATIHGKLAIYSLLCITPIILIRAAGYIPFKILRVPVIAVMILLICGLITLYYFKASTLIPEIPHYHGEKLDTSGSDFQSFFNIFANFFLPFMMDFAYIYLWYASPFFFCFVAIPVTVLLAKVDIPHFVKAIIFGVAAVPVMLLIPFLVIVAGAFVGLVVGVVILIVAVVVILLFIFGAGAYADATKETTLDVTYSDGTHGTATVRKY